MKVKGPILLDDDGKAVRFVDSPNRGGVLKPLYLVMHYTAGLSLDGSVSWLANPAAKASAHLVIGRDGTIVQMVRFDRIAWHAGQSKWGPLEGLNAHSIGIELDNAGKLQRLASGAWAFVTASGSRVIPDDEVVVARHPHEQTDAGWHVYTPAQLKAAAAAGAALHAQLGFADVLGHEDISPGRKTDPGPAFPMSGYRSQVLGRA